MTSYNVINSFFLFAGFIFLVGPGVLIVEELFPKFDAHWKVSLGTVIGICLAGTLILLFNSLSIKLTKFSLAIGIMICYLIAFVSKFCLKTKRHNKVNRSVTNAKSFWNISNQIQKVYLEVIFFVFLVAAFSFTFIHRESYTEFYIDLENAPWRRALTESAPVIIHIVSHETKDESFTMTYLVNGKTIKSINMGIIKPGEENQLPVILPPPTNSTNKYLFVLYKAGITKPYRQLNYWVNR